jgi:hypothetical protein
VLLGTAITCRPFDNLRSLKAIGLSDSCAAEDDADEDEDGEDGEDNEDGADVPAWLTTWAAQSDANASA